MDKYGHIGEGGDAVKNGRRQESPGGERTGGSRADNSASGEARVTSSSKVKGRAASVGNEVGFYSIPPNADVTVMSWFLNSISGAAGASSQRGGLLCRQARS